jgi:hypothetical protein
MEWQHHPVPHLWPSFKSKTARFGRLPPRSQCNLKSPLQGFQYTNDRGKLAEGRIVARDIADPMGHAKGKTMAYTA